MYLTLYALNINSLFDEIEVVKSTLFSQIHSTNSIYNLKFLSIYNIIIKPKCY